MLYIKKLLFFLQKKKFFMYLFYLEMLGNTYICVFIL